MFLTALFPLQQTHTQHHSHESCHEHRLQTSPRYHWICLQIVSICQSLLCLLLASLWLNFAMQKQTLSGPAKKLGVLFLACSLIETAAWELCGVFPPQSFQLRTVCSYSSLSRVCTCAESQAAGVSPANTLPKHARLQGMLRGQSLRCETSTVVCVCVCVVTHSDTVRFSILNSSLCRISKLLSTILEWLCKLFFCYVSDLMIEADVIHGVLWLQLLECIKTKSFTAFKSFFHTNTKSDGETRIYHLPAALSASHSALASLSVLFCFTAATSFISHVFFQSVFSPSRKSFIVK